MTDRKLAILAIAAVILAGWAILQNRLTRQTGASGLFQSAPLIQGMNLDAIAEISVVSDAGAAAVTLKQKDGRFSVVEKDFYPATVSAINTLLNSCLDIRVAEPITVNSANHADLGVTDDTARYAVRFRNAEGKEITGVFISERRSDPEGGFVRLTTADPAYFIQSPPWLSTTATSFMNTSLIEVNRTSVRQVTVSGPEGEYTLTAAADGTVTLGAMPEDSQFKGTDYQSVFGALGSLRFEDVMAAENAPADLAWEHRFVCRLEDSTIYTLRLAQRDDRQYVTLTAEFTDTSPVQVGRTESEEELRKKEAKLLAMDAAQAFAQRHNGWVYVISSVKAQELTKPLSDLLEPKPEPEPESEPKQAADTETQNTEI